MQDIQYPLDVIIRPDTNDPIFAQISIVVSGVEASDIKARSGWIAAKVNQHIGINMASGGYIVVESKNLHLNGLRFEKYSRVPLIWLNSEARNSFLPSLGFGQYMDILRDRPNPTGERVIDMYLTKALIKGASLIPFYDNTPLRRLFGHPPVESGYVLRFPNSSDRIVLPIDTSGMPMISPSVFAKLENFLNDPAKYYFQPGGTA